MECGRGLGESLELGGRRILALEGSGEWDIGGRKGRLRAKEGNLMPIPQTH